jgi:hypothetical protein
MKTEEEVQSALENLDRGQMVFLKDIYERVHKMSREEQLQAVNNLCEITGAPKILIKQQIKDLLEERTLKHKLKKFRVWLVWPVVSFIIWTKPETLFSIYGYLKEIMPNHKDPKCSCFNCVLKRKEKNEALDD